MTSVLSQNKYLLALGAGCAFAAYAVYFDYQRRHAPDYKDKLRAKRKASQQVRQPNVIIPGEQLLLEGKEKEGIEHLAIAVCAAPVPQQVLAILHQSLQYEHFQLLTAFLPEAKKRVFEMFNIPRDENDSDAEEVVIQNLNGRIVNIDAMDELEDLE